jgi:GWxTD domain-containing protein
MARALVGLVGLCWTVLHAPLLGAQDAPDRRALEQLRDSLATAADTASLKRLEKATIEVAKRTRDDPLIHLRLGFIAYRLGELSGKSHLDDAAGEFEWAAELRPSWPYPWYGDGLAELALGEHGAIALENLRQVLGKDYLSLAARAFARAAEADPAFAQATVDLVRTALAQRIGPRLDLALRAVREAAASPAQRNPAIQLARGRVERAAGHADSALAAFHAYLAVGGDSGVALLEQARTFYFIHEPDSGSAAYFAGAARSASAEAAALYRADLAWIASDSERTAFDRQHTAPDRARWLTAFWERRGMADAREPGERLAEHYRRWFYALRNFRLVSRHRHYDITERYRAEQDQLDDRGVIYLRQGAPDARATYIASDSVEPNESWLYHRPDGDLIFHFVARKGVQDYKLVESLADALTAGFGGALALQTRRGMGPVASGLFASRSTLSPLYTRLGDVLGSANVRGTLGEERVLGQRSIAVGTTTDSYRWAFDLPLDVVVSEFVVGDSLGAGGALHIVFAIPARRLPPIAADGRVVYPLTFRLYVSDPDGALVQRLDTTRVFAARAPLPSGAFLSGQLAVSLPAGRYRYRLLVQQAGGGAGDLLGRDSIVVGTLTGQSFAMSDLVVGRADAGLVWSDRGDTVFLNPLEQFTQGGTAELYYEVYGVPAGAAYHTAVQLEREGGRSLFGAIARLFGGGGRTPVTFGFDATSDGPVTRVHRQIAMGDVPRGRYVLSVRITHPTTGVTLTQRHRFEVLPHESVDRRRGLP